MDRLPLELCYKITAHLTCNEKQNLSLLSRHWHELIKNYNMFSDLTIQGKGNFGAAIIYFEQNEKQRQQVKSLCISDTEARLHQISKLAHQFPALKDFAWINDQYELCYGPLEVEKLQSWSKITSYYEDNIAFALLESILPVVDKFVNLTRLTLNCAGVGEKLIEQLFKMPRIKDADLSGVNWYFFDLQKVHKYWPLLETLQLTDFHQPMCFDYNDWEDIIRGEYSYSRPAKRLTHLKLQDAVPIHYTSHGHRISCGLSPLWLLYISTKYKNLMHLTILDNNLARRHDSWYENSLATMISSISYLQTYNVNFYPITNEITRSFDECDAQLPHVHLYNNPIPQLTCLKTSLQESSIHTITLTTNSVDINTYSALSGMSNLQHLTINGVPDQTAVRLNDLLCELPQLVSLTIAKCTIAPIADNTDHYNFMTQLKTLVLKDVTFPNVPSSNVDQSNTHMCYIARKCPSLSSLRIDGDVQDSTRLLKVEFLHFKLKSIDINITNMQYYKIYNEMYIAWYKLDETGKLTPLREMPRLKEESYVSILYEGRSSNVKIGGHDIPKW